MSISMMPRQVAEQITNIAGIGRGSPNQNPFLPPPNRSSQLGGKTGMMLSRLSLGAIPGVALRRDARLSKRFVSTE